MQLRDYQIEISTQAAQLLNEFKIVYLSMQVRTGKTITSLETAKKYGAKNVLFVTKKKAISSICDDYNANYVTNFNLIVTNFEALHKIDLINHAFDLVIIDEAHSLGQYPVPSERTNLLRLICYKLPIIFLSGTPSPESYSQLFHQFYVSSFSPFKHSNFYQWAKYYVLPKTKYVFNRSIPDYSNAKKEDIDSIVNHLFIPYTQEEAGFTQLVEEQVHIVKVSDKIHKICNRLRIDKVITGKDGQVIEADTAVKLLNKLHQLASGTVLFDVNPHNTSNGAMMDDSKINYILSTFAGQKMAIFYKFRAEFHLISIYAKKAGYNVTESPEHFNFSDDKTIFVSQFQSGREGINLSTADCLICYNIDFSAVTYWQARARMQSKDRSTPAMLHWIFSNVGIEQRIFNAVSQKKNYTLSYFKHEEKSLHNGTEQSY